MLRIGIDIGGTFTDLCVVADGGYSYSEKLLTTPTIRPADFCKSCKRPLRPTRHTRTWNKSSTRRRWPPTRSWNRKRRASA